jgi:hypothetical protein
MKDTLTLSDNVAQQLPEFVAFHQRLDNQIWAHKAENKVREASHNTNITPRALPTNHTSFTISGTYCNPLNLSINLRIFTLKEY